jgi:hypothetical protein
MLSPVVLAVVAPTLVWRVFAARNIGKVADAYETYLADHLKEEMRALCNYPLAWRRRRVLMGLDLRAATAYAGGVTQETEEAILEVRGVAPRRFDVSPTTLQSLEALFFVLGIWFSLALPQIFGWACRA